jgi:hypothetical protein
MEIKEWKGVVTAASPYALPPGANAVQHNVQVRKAGQLAPRDGMGRIAASDDGPLLGAHRLTGGSGTSDKVLLYRNNVGDSTARFTLETLTQSGNAVALSEVFSTNTVASHRPSFCEDRHGTAYIFFGSGIQPQILRRNGTATLQCGLPPPTVAPSITPQGDGFFIERVDVTVSGTSYFRPPTITVSGGSPDRQADLRAVIQGGSIVAIDVIDGGSNYKTMPTVTVSNEQIGEGFLATGVIASGAAIYGYPTSESPSNTVSNYTATWTHAANTTSQPPQIAYRLPNNNTTLYADTVYDSAVARYTALIPLGPTATATSTNATTITSGNDTITVQSVGNFAVGMEVTISSEYFTPNPVILAVNSGNSTLRLDRPALSGGTSLTVPVTAVAPSGAFAQISFSTVSQAFRLGQTAPSHGTGTERFTKLTTDTSDFTYFQSRSAWNTGTSNNYFENLNWANSREGELYFNWFFIEYRNRDGFWAFMPSPTLGRRFMNNQKGAGNLSSSGDLFAASFNVSGSNFNNNYFPTYQGVGVRMLTGTSAQSATESQWTVVNCNIGLTANSRPYIDVTLQPMRKNDGTAYTRVAQTVDPVLRFYLSYCPEEWLVAGPGDTGWVSPSTNPLPQARLYSPQTGEGRRSRFNDTIDTTASPGDDPVTAKTPILVPGSGWVYRSKPGTADSRKNLGTRWWAKSEGPEETYRPVVDFRTGKTVTGDNTSNGLGLGDRMVEVVNPGSALERGTKYWIRFEQYDASHYEAVAGSYFDTWRTPTTYAPAPRAYPTTAMFRNGAFGVTYTDFYFEASDLDTSANAQLLALPGAVVGTPFVAIPGSKWASQQTGRFTLRQINPANANPPSTETNSNEYTFTAKTLIPSTPTTRIGAAQIVSGGSNYFRAPTILVRDGGGYGLRCSALVQNGAVQFVTILEGGEGYTSAPTLYTSVEPAQLMPVLRGTMQGTYRCAYRFADYSQTAVANVQIATTSQSPNATLSAASALIKPGMRITGHSGIPHMTQIKSVDGTQLILSTNATATVASGSGSAVVRDMELPVTYSDFSPIVDIDADVNGTGRASRFDWSLTGVTPPPRADHVEFYRTSGDQSLVFYRLNLYGTVSSSTIALVGTDGLSDEELFDLERPNYAALPVVLPNGSLNAFRFGLARSDMAVAVSYQDRLWYAVSTSGADTNTVFFSEYDEFESCPDTNELPLQNNLRTTDYITALVPFGSTLLAMQTAHAYSIAYNTDPAVDPVVQLQGHRGCLCQQTWDVFDDMLYVADERGIYRMARSGAIESLSEVVRNVFDEGQINFAYRRNFFLKVDQVAGVLRFFYTPTGVNSEFPTTALCFHIANGAWWTESWPNALTCATDFRPTNARERSIYGAADGSAYDFSGTRDFAYRDIVSVAVTNGGFGYTSPPTVTVTASTGRGASFLPIVVDGVVTEILVRDGGYGYGAIDVQTFTSTVSLSISAPPSGTQATAVATARLPAADWPTASQPMRTTVGWRLQTGAMTLQAEGNTRGGDGLIDRSVAVTYRPTPAPKTLLLREYYNNRSQPRVNVMRRDRGTGWVHGITGACSTLEMSDARSPLGPSTGMAKAMFGGRSLSDVGSSDKHLSVELACDPQQDTGNTDPQEALIYSLAVNGVTDGD